MASRSKRSFAYWPSFLYVFTSGDSVMIYETVAIWEGSFYSHESLTIEEAQEWAQQYQHKDCKTRIWAVIR